MSSPIPSSPKSLRPLAALCLLVALGGCASGGGAPAAPSPTPLAGRITFAGSTTVQPLATALGERFQDAHPAVEMEIAAGGSSVGIQAVHDGTADIGMASRALRDDEGDGIRGSPIALDVLAVVIHPDNPVSELSVAQLRAIYAGETVNWQEVGGRDAPIVVVAREESSGTRGAFDELVLAGEAPRAPSLQTAITAGDVAFSIGNERAAIGYVGFGNLDESLKVITIDGISPSAQSAREGRYRLVRPLLLLTGPLSHPLAQRFIDFATSAEGQAIVTANGWVATADE